jgi:16S rRNA (guanine527-N7)-methyltransferase
MSRARSAAPLPGLTADRARALALTPVSRETAERLDRFVELLLRWQRTTNLIASSTIPQLWTRHIADSLQLLDLAPHARAWVDLGSGAGLPGLVIACALAGKPGALVHLIESNSKKAAFLREAQRVTAAPAAVHAERMEEFAATFRGRVDIVTARAVAPLKMLVDQCFPLLARTGATALFAKGRNAEHELREAVEAWTVKSWNPDVAMVPSRTDPAARIIVVRNLPPGRTKP